MTVPEIPRRQPTHKPMQALVDDGIRVLVLDDLEAIAGYMRAVAKPDCPLRIRAGADAEPAELAHLRHLTPHELRSVMIRQMTEKYYLSVSIGIDGHIAIDYDGLDEPATTAAERVRQLVQNLPRKPNRRRYPPGVVVLWLSGLALSVGNLFVGPAVLKWLLIGRMSRPSLNFGGGLHDRQAAIMGSS